ncbi:MAG: DUF4145 domain-containing protein [Vicinamibacterales bacterium]
MSEASTNSVQRRRIYCNRCRGETNHTWSGSHSREEQFDFDDGSAPIWQKTNYRLWACAGCDHAVMEVERESSLDTPDDGPTYQYHPPRTRDDLDLKVFRRIPTRLRSIYTQTIKSYNYNLRVLCAAGLRALIEGICADKAIQGRNLMERIDGLEAHLPKSIVTNLHGFRFMGNEAVHELTAPSLDDLKIAIEVSEDLLNFLYELDYKASRLQKRTSSAATTP